ncbi:MAG TPA: FadR/GntR family transcriptional regulator [Caldimonas sp.]|jgi:DNA-binding FadR family transcriptional regulator|nr:FadR/GntR family transcriptional regulator [Caldimonas sp.]HEX2543033.1 FadR/GntR family transcriptional regulator [Caldimonas sp.]
MSTTHRLGFAPATLPATPDAFVPPRRRPRGLAHELVESLGRQIRDGRLSAGAKLPTEAAFTAEFQVSRSVVREAISRLQTEGLVETRHGVGTFVVRRPEGSAFRIGPAQLATLQDVIAMLELRIGVEVEAAGLAAQRRSVDNLRTMRDKLDAFTAALQEGRDAVSADFQFHLEIMRATQNPHFAQLLLTLGTPMIPRSRLDPPVALDVERQNYLRRVHAEHESILDAIAGQDADAARAAVRTHLANSRERRRRSMGAGGSINQ